MPNNVMFTGYYPGLSSSLWTPHHYHLCINVSLSQLLLISEIGRSSQLMLPSIIEHLCNTPTSHTCIYASMRPWRSKEEGRCGWRRATISWVSGLTLKIKRGDIIVAAAVVIAIIIIVLYTVENGGAAVRLRRQELKAVSWILSTQRLTHVAEY